MVVVLVVMKVDGIISAVSRRHLNLESSSVTLAKIFFLRFNTENLVFKPNITRTY